MRSETRMSKVTVDGVELGVPHSRADAVESDGGGGTRRARILSLAALVGALTGPAVAAEKRDPAAEARTVAYQFAECTIKRNRKLAERIVLEQLRNSELMDRYHVLITGDCVPVGGWGTLEVRFPEPHLQYALATVMVRSDPSLTVTEPSSIPPLKHRGIDEAEYRPKPGKRVSDKRAAKLIEDRSEALARVALSLVGECVVRAAPAQSATLVRSEIASPAERAAFSSILPGLQGCLPAGKQISFSREVLRGIVAMNFYRLAKAPRMPVQAPGAPK